VTSVGEKEEKVNTIQPLCFSHLQNVHTQMGPISVCHTIIV